MSIHMDDYRDIKTPEQRIEALAIEFHKNIEGEYGCNGVTCPGVQRLIAHFRASIGIGKANYQKPDPVPASSRDAAEPKEQDEPIAICGRSATGDPCLPGTTQGEPPTERGHCPKCGSDIGSGYGLAYGGMGVYYFCDGEKECNWFYKIQDSE